MNMSIEYKGKLHFFEKTGQLTDKMFHDRSWFIVKNATAENVESYADLWVSHRYFGVIYSQHIMEKLGIYESNMACP